MPDRRRVRSTGPFGVVHAAGVAGRPRHLTRGQAGSPPLPIAPIVPGFDWDKARSDRLRAERGTEPVWGPCGPPRPSRKPASAAHQTAAIERWLSDFKVWSYEEQLGSMGGLRRDLTRLLGSDEAAADVVRDRFKPYLKLRRTKPPVRTAHAPVAARKPPRQPTGRPARQPTAQPIDDPARAILELVRRRPGQLTQKECQWVLRGLATDALRRRGLTRDEQFGSFAQRAGALQVAVKQLRDRGAIATAADGKLYVSGRGGA